jgi:hypothetical protein
MKMAYSTTLSSAASYFTANNSTVTIPENRVIARVVDVVLDKNHPDYELFGKDQAINGIRYKVLSSSQDEEESTGFPFAYCGNVSIVKVPLVNELVEIVTDVADSVVETSYKPKAYYTKIVNVWNNAHHNASPDINLSDEDISLGEDVEEVSSMRSLHPFPGDLIMEGRLGQSIRFSGYFHENSPLTLEDRSNNGKPFTVVRVGQNDEDSLDRYVEDINADSSSIYLTSDHIVTVETVNKKNDTFRDSIPVELDKYRGNQVVIDSGRLVFHAKEDHLILNSINSINLVGSTLNLDGIEYTSIDSQKIYLGAKAKEPVLKGDITIKLLSDILSALTSLVTTHSLATPATAHVQLIAASQGILPKIQTFKSKLESLKSKKVFTE